MSENTGIEVAAFLEFDEPRCSLTYGTGFCASVLGTTGQHKCFNTRKTCQDPENYDPSETYTTRIGLQQEGVLRYGRVIPIMTAPPSVTPGTVNIGGMEPSASAFGQREVVNIRAQDTKHSDVGYDKYRLERYTGDASLLGSGDASAGSADSLTLEAEVPNLVGKTLRLTAGAGSVQERKVARVNGLVATVSPRWRTNLVLHSNDLSQAAWSKGNITLTPNGETAPDGTQVDVVAATATAWASVTQSFNLDASSTYTFRRLVKRITAQPISRFGFYNNVNGWDAGLNLRVNWNASPVTIDVMLGTGTAFIEEVGGGWYLVGGTFTSHASDLAYGWYNYPRSGGDEQAGDALALGKFQLEKANDVTDYIETSAAAIVLPDATTDYTVHDAYDPYERGSFWPKWLARNPYYVNYPARVRWGAMGQALEDMETRHYMLDSITLSEGSVGIKLKDLFSKVEARKAVFPFPSGGRLDGAITGTPATFDVAPAGIGDTPESEGGYAHITDTTAGYLAIGDEVVHCTRVGDTFTFTNDVNGQQRGCLGSTQEDHDDEDAVQAVGSISGRAHENVNTLLTEYAGVDSANIPFADWAVKAQQMTATTFKTNVPEPTPVEELISELEVQAGFSLWHDTRTNRVEFQPLRPTVPVKVVDDVNWIKDRSLNLKRQDSKRVSRVLFYYGMRNVLGDLDDPANFHGLVVTPSLESELPEQYGSKSIREVFSRWVQAGGRAAATEGATRLLSVFRDPPQEGSFDLHLTRDGELQRAIPFLLRVAEAQDATGVLEDLTMVPVSIERDMNTLTINAQELNYAMDLGDPNLHEIFIENTSTNINLRTMHDSLYASPTGIETIKFYVEPEIIVGSTSTSGYAIDTGDWPAGVDLQLINQGWVVGKGGRGGNYYSNGEAGGTAIKVRYAISIDNEFGVIGGGGGGGGGGNQFDFKDENDFFGNAGGGGGGSGAGYTASAIGASQATWGGWSLPTGTASQGALEIGGAGAAGGKNAAIVGWGDPARGGNGGKGGDLGQAGANGSAAYPSFHPAERYQIIGAVGTGGAAGAAVDGNSMVTWVNSGDVRGALI